MSDTNAKLCLITGASRGIGKAVMQTLAEEGSYVIGTATSEAGSQAITDYLKQKDLPGHGMVLDITRSDSIDALFLELAAQKKLPSVLVNNAGITEDDLLLRMSDDAWYRVIEANLNGVFKMTRASIKSMFRSRWGRIITIGSVVGSSGNSGQTNYSAAKAGIIGFSKSLAQEMGSRGITVNVVAPGFIDTDMTDALPDFVKDEMLKRIAVRRFGSVNDIANTVAFLASDKAAYITGETIHVNGGMYMD